MCYDLLWRAMPWLLVVGRVQDSRQWVLDVGCRSGNIPDSGRIAGCSAPDLQQPATKASHAIGGHNTYSLELLMMDTEVPETCSAYYKCNKPSCGIQLVFLLYTAERSLKCFAFFYNIDCSTLPDVSEHCSGFSFEPGNFHVARFLTSKIEIICFLTIRQQPCMKFLSPPIFLLSPVPSYAQIQSVLITPVLIYRDNENILK